MSSKEKVHPSVKNLRLSEERVEGVVEEIIQNFTESAIGRKLIRTTLLRKDDKRREESGFISVALNHIVDKIWFVDGAFNGTFYSHMGIGAAYGRAIADGETSHVVNCILDKCAENRIPFEGEIHPSDILRALKLLQQRNVKAKVILTNVKDHVQLYDNRNLQAHAGEILVPRVFSGYTYDVKIHFFRGLLDGTLIFVDPERIGELLVKKSVENTAEISEIKSSERAKIIENLSIHPEVLDEKVRLRVYETIKVNIIEPKAGLILKRES